MPYNQYRTYWYSIGCILLLQGLCLITKAQHSKTDSFLLKPRKGILGKILNSITTTCNNQNTIAFSNTLTAFAAFEGKTIDSIIIEPANIKKQQNKLENILQQLQPKTRERVIKNNLFFKSGESLSPITIADNDRYLRTLPFIQDAQIVATPSLIDSNKVNIKIYYKDILPFSAEVDANTENAYLNARDENFLGTGNQLNFQSSYDVNRTNKNGFGFNFTKRNFWGSFLNIGLIYSNIGTSFTTGKRDETSFAVNAELPLISPYSMWTGQAEFGQKYTSKLYNYKSDYANALNYRFTYEDVWVGYNISCKQLLQEQGITRKAKHFIALRIANKEFSNKPADFSKNYNANFDNQSLALASYTIFKQNFLKTNYIYGFGRYEDLPEGYSASLIGGWNSYSLHKSWYAGVEAQKSGLKSCGTFYNIGFKSGANMHRNNLENIAVQGNFETISALKSIQSGKWHYRHFISGSATHIFNPGVTNHLLQLNSALGLPLLKNPDSVRIQGRYSVNVETVFFNAQKCLGFNIAPFVFSNFSFLQSAIHTPLPRKTYMAFGAGLRTRNEYLVFGTMELKATFFPKTTGNMNHWNVSILSGLRFRYNTQYIKRPDFINMN